MVDRYIDRYLEEVIVKGTLDVHPIFKIETYATCADLSSK